MYFQPNRLEAKKGLVDTRPFLFEIINDFYKYYVRYIYSRYTFLNVKYME